LGSGLLLRLEHGLEVDLGQHDGREAGARADVGDDGAQVGVDHLRADDADDALHLLLRDVADLEDAGLLGFDQEQHALADLGRHGRRDGDLDDALGHLFGADPEVDVDLWLLLLEQDLPASSVAPATRSLRYMRWIWKTGVESLIGGCLRW
jgi:hypothetical protein